MSYQLTVIPKQDYLHIRVSGVNATETVTSYLAQVHQECRSRNCFRVLIEENLNGSGLDMLDIYEIASKGSEPAAEDLRKVAYVDTNPDHSFSDMKFAETVAHNRGLNIRMFSTLVEAELWMREV